MEKNTNKKTIIGWGVTILLPLIIGVIPVQGMFTENLRKFFMITEFVILIIAFELIPKLAASILLPTLYLITGLAPVEVAFGSWTNTTVWMVLGGLVFSAVLEECGLLERIAYFYHYKMWWNICGNSICLLCNRYYSELDYIL